jgi:hypothetical protein
MESWGDALAEDNSDAMALKRCGYSFGDGLVGLDMFHAHSGYPPGIGGSTVSLLLWQKPATPSLTALTIS